MNFLVISGYLTVFIILGQIYLYLKPQANVQKFETKKCSPRRFVFQKIHKTGSTFVEQILRNFAKSQQFNISAKSMRYGGYKGGFPGKFNSSFYPKDDHNLGSFVGHFVWNWSEIRKVLFRNGEDFIKITIVRNPMDVFLSSYNYFYLRHKQNMKWLKAERNGDPRKFWRHATCAGEPGICLIGAEL